MYPLLGGLKSLIKTDDVAIDNSIFKLHYKATVIALLAASVLVVSKDYFGDPITCMGSASHDENKLPDAIKNYCWITSTFTLPKALDKKVGVQVPHPGLDKTQPGDEKVYHKYYQWVCFFLFFQAVLFYVPRYLWKTTESGKIRSIVEGVNSLMKPGARNEKLEILAAYLVKSHNQHIVYAFTLFACEILNFANVVGQIYFVNRFLGGEFTTYGTKVISVSEQELVNRTDPMIQVFPRITKCSFHTYGPSGDIQILDVICILPQNVLNEKIFIFFWFWFIILAVLSGLMVVYRLGLVLSSTLRYRLMQSLSHREISPKTRQFLRDGSFGDWVVLNSLRYNLDNLNFRELLDAIDKALGSGSEEKKSLLPNEYDQEYGKS